MKTPVLLLTLAALPLIAADVTGTWKSEFDSQIGTQKYTFTFKQDGAKLTGNANSEVNDQKREAELKEGKVDGDTISFVETLKFQDNDIRITYTGKVSTSGNEIKFTREVGDFAKEEIVARREQGAPAAAAPAARTIRIKAGKSEPVKDAEGNVWLADQGFEGGQTIDRPDIQIANTKSPDLYRAERYSMDSFSWPVSNGKYVMKLHFAETFEGITGPGQRVFSYNVEGHEFKDFDVWVKAGGPLRAYVETVNVEATNGVIKVTFTPNVENPQINAIEIIPKTTDEPGAAAPASAAAAPASQTSTATSPSATPVLQIDAGKGTGTVSPMLYGLMTEEINYSYVEIGNEDWFDRSGSYEGRFAQFYDAIKAKYPSLQVISTMGYEHPSQIVRSRVPDLVDEHYYRSQEDMQAHALDYDKYSRTNKTKIFCGEWATRVGSPTPDMAGALGDAAWMTGMERNSDILVMSCYAPLFVNVSQLNGQGRSMQWSTDLIGYDALSSYGSPAYYAQKMFSTMHGDEILATDSQNIPTREWQARANRGGTPPPPRQIGEIFFDATRNSQSGIIFLKVVNEGGAAPRINVRISGAPKIEAQGEVVSLTASSPNDTNSLEQPQKIVPRAEKADNLSANFTREFPAYSITVLKLKTK